MQFDRKRTENYWQLKLNFSYQMNEWITWIFNKNRLFIKTNTIEKKVPSIWMHHPLYAWQIAVDRTFVWCRWVQAFVNCISQRGKERMESERGKANKESIRDTAIRTEIWTWFDGFVVSVSVVICKCACDIDVWNGNIISKWICTSESSTSFYHHHHHDFWADLRVRMCPVWFRTSLTKSICAISLPKPVHNFTLFLSLSLSLSAYLFFSLTFVVSMWYLHSHSSLSSCLTTPPNFKI